MARKRPHEDHINHEAWAIPYGDLITLLLAFFVVMYAMSSVNEGKYRILSNSLNTAFKGSGRGIHPVDLGEPDAVVSSMKLPVDIRPQLNVAAIPLADLQRAQEDIDRAVMLRLQEELAELIGKGMINVERADDGIHLNVGSDFLFASGSARVDAAADPILQRLAAVLAPLIYPLRVEGHTDNVPISTLQFPSNWELSASRAAWIVRRIAENGVDPKRLSMQGFGEHQPVASNDTLEGRRRNRRVEIIVDTRLTTPLRNAAFNGPKPAKAGT